ncbi:MAG: UvrD-helicase domain-containing protein [Lachnospiraceae bacterium]|nr:UvrD-helicase domain-containing protein [Lachnospiraceae bacterium]
MSIYDSLNTEQYRAVTTTEGPLLILAGAGSGKTRVVTHRICYLIDEKGVSPANILAITFTNKAAQEMRERVDRLIGAAGAAVWVSTFHSMCVRILRRFIERLGYESDFSIYDPDDCKTVVKTVMKRLQIDTKFLAEKTAYRAISDCKNRFISEAQYENMASDYTEQQIAKVYREYQRELKKNNALDFDDLLYKTVELFIECPDVLAVYQDRFRYIHVDEYQDTNPVQFKLVKLMAGERKNLCVVGDDDQSIYKFRGADISNILDFERYFKNAVVVKLEQNYRSTPNILNVANAVIANNRGRKAKRLWSDRPAGDPVTFRLYQDGKAEAQGVINDIDDFVKEGGEYNECAVLYRTNAQSRAFEEYCLYKNIPYRIVGGVNFYQRAEVKDILAYLKTIENGRDDIAVARIVNVPRRGIGDTTVGRVAAYAQEKGISLYDAFASSDLIPDVGRSKQKIDGFVNCIRVLRAKSQEMTVDKLIEEIIKDINYEDELDKLDDDVAQTKKENLEELRNKAAEFIMACEDEGREGSLSEFLEEIALVADIDSVEEGENRVLLMTLHGAKGLEFNRVYLCGLEEDLFPSMMSVSESAEGIEEERRLAYVGFTRAKDTLKLSAARQRMMHGDIFFHDMSRFVKEIPDGMVKFLKDAPSGSYGRSTSAGYGSGSYGSESNGSSGYTSYGGRSFKDNSFTARSSYGSQDKKLASSIAGTNPGYGKDVSALLGNQAFSIDYTTGDRVEHKTFGEGVVRTIEKGPKDYVVTVDFDSGDTKKMMAGFAKLKKI